MTDHTSNISADSSLPAEDQTQHFTIPYSGVGGREQVLSSMLDALANEIPLLVLIGETGSGKTTLCEIIYNSIPDGFDGIYFPEAVESFEDVVRLLYKEVNREDAPKSTTSQNLVEIMATTLSERETRLILIFDQAERIFLATLERIRRLLDKFNESRILVQIVFSGKRSFLGNLRQLRIVNFNDAEEREYHLEPLDVGDIDQYIGHALKANNQNLPEGVSSLDLAVQVHQRGQGNFCETNAAVDEILLQIQNNTLRGKKSARREKGSDTGATSLFAPLRSLQLGKILPDFRSLSFPHFTFFSREKLKEKLSVIPAFFLRLAELLAAAGNRFSEKHYLQRCIDRVKATLGAVGGACGAFILFAQKKCKSGWAAVVASTKNIRAPKLPSVTLPTLHAPKIPSVSFKLPSIKVPSLRLPSIKFPVIRDASIKLIGGSVVAAILIVFGLRLVYRDEIAQVQTPIESTVKKSTEELKTPVELKTDTGQSAPIAETDKERLQKKDAPPEKSVQRNDEIAEGKGSNPAQISSEAGGKNAAGASSTALLKAEQSTSQDAIQTGSLPPAKPKHEATVAMPVESHAGKQTQTTETVKAKEQHETHVVETPVVRKITLEQKKKIFEVAKEEANATRKPEHEPERKVDPANAKPPVKTTDADKAALADLKQQILSSDKAPKDAADAKNKQGKNEATDVAYKRGVKAGERWVGQKNDNRYTVQLTSGSPENAQAILKELSTQDNYKEIADKITIVKSAGSGNVTLYYGDYASMTEARNARNAIPTTLKRYNPYAISVDGALNKNNSR